MRAPAGTDDTTKASADSGATGAAFDGVSAAAAGRAGSAGGVFPPRSAKMPATTPMAITSAATPSISPLPAGGAASVRGAASAAAARADGLIGVFIIAVAPGDVVGPVFGRI